MILQGMKFWLNQYRNNYRSNYFHLVRSNPSANRTTYIDSNVLLLCLLLFSSMQINAQSRAYYLTNHFQDADLILVNLHNNRYDVERVYAFGDSVLQLEKDLSAYLPGTLGMHASFPEQVPAFTDVKPAPRFSSRGHPTESNVLDSVEVLGRWHKIYLHEYDDGFVGGMPNQVNRYVLVKGIGLVYSYASFRNGHSLYMLCHEDSNKQKVLTAVHAHLAQTSPWFLEVQMAALSAKYDFAHCFTTLRDEWMASRRHLAVHSVSATTVERHVNYTAVLKNTSMQAYYLPSYTSVSPTSVVVHYPDSATWSNDLLTEHYGVFYKRLSEDLYLLPGEEVPLSHRFPETLACGHCPASIYTGLQVLSNVSLLGWLGSETKTHEGNVYWLFPHREILE